MVEISLEPSPLKRNYYFVDEVERMNPDSVHLSRMRRSTSWRPPTDVFETREAVVVRVEIAGMQETDFTIILDGSNLMIRGMRQDVSERRAYHQMEIRFGEFSVDVELPTSVDADNVLAVYQNGFLRVTLPKARPQHIQIE